MKLTYLFLILSYSSLALAGDCHQILHMIEYGHKRDREYTVKLCGTSTQTIEVQINQDSRVIEQKHVAKILAKFKKVDLATSVEELVKNCSAKSKRSYVTAQFHMPNEKMQTLCLYDKSPPLFNYTYFVKELMHSDAYN